MQCLARCFRRELVDAVLDPLDGLLDLTALVLDECQAVAVEDLLERTVRIVGWNVLQDLVRLLQIRLCTVQG